MPIRKGSYYANRDESQFPSFLTQIAKVYHITNLKGSRKWRPGRVPPCYEKWEGFYCNLYKGSRKRQSRKFMFRQPGRVSKRFRKGFGRVPIRQIGRVLIETLHKLEGPLFANQEGFLKGFGRVPIAQLGKGIFFTEAESFQTRQFGRVLISSIRKDF